MKIVVIGGSGLIGKKLIPLLRGHEAADSRSQSISRFQPLGVDAPQLSDRVWNLHS